MASLKHVIILVNNNTIEVVPKRINISRRAQEQVCWHAPQYGATITFKPSTGSPFEGGEYQVPKGGSVATGPAGEQAKIGSFEYGVMVKVGSGPPIKVDPEVFVED